MTNMQVGVLAAIFVAVCCAVMCGMYVLTPSVARRRLRELESPAAAADTKTVWVEKFAAAAGKLARLSAPDEHSTSSPLRARFMNAGFRGTNAPAIFFAGKTVLALVSPAAAYFSLALSGSPVSLQMYMAALLGSATVGYYLPNVVLRRLIFVRQREIFEVFPDALDLMTVCIEAGLAIEAALMKVGDEIRHKSRVLSEELNLVTLELRAGAAKEVALRNLALRTGVEDIDALVAMLIQAERFGTSIADSLRIYADMLRTKRRQRAEEAAAKIALKLLFPLIFCIFPSMLLVLLGPGVIRITRVLLPIITGGH